MALAVLNAELRPRPDKGDLAVETAAITFLPAAPVCPFLGSSAQECSPARSGPLRSALWYAGRLEAEVGSL